MADRHTNTTDVTRGASLRERVTSRKLELERAFARLAPDDRSRREIALALNEVSGLLTGDLDHIPRVVAVELDHWLESNEHVNERIMMEPVVDAPTAGRSPRRLGCFEDLVAFLVAHKVAHTADPARFTVEIASPPPALPGPAIVRWEQRIPYVQVMQQILGPVPEDRVPDVETAISHVNDAAMIPGYGYSYNGHAIYYRLLVPIYDGGISSDSLDRAITAVLNSALQLEPAFKRIVEGAAGTGVLGHWMLRT